MSVPSNLVPTRISQLPEYGGTSTAGYFPYVLSGVTYKAQLGDLLTASSGTVTSINASGGSTGLTFSGGPVTTSGTLTLSGTLAVSYGGTGITSFGTGVATALGQNVSGSGSLALTTSPTLVTPALGTPSSGALTNCTGLPISTGVSGLGTGVATALGQSVTGSGSVVLSTSPTLVTPVLGTPGSGTLTNCTGLPVSTGVSGLGADVATFLATPSSANLRSALTDETGTGAAVFATSPTLITPALGTPSSGALTNCTGLPISTGVSGLGSGVATFLATPSATNFASALTGVTFPTSGVLATRAATETLTNKRITPRVSNATNITSPLAWNSDNYDAYVATAQAEALTISADGGTPTDTQSVILRLKDNGTGRALTWTTGSSKAFRALGVTLPTTTTANKTMYVGCKFNAADDRWDVVSVVEEA